MRVFATIAYCGNILLSNATQPSIHPEMFIRCEEWTQRIKLRTVAKPLTHFHHVSQNANNVHTRQPRWNIWPVGQRNFSGKANPLVHVPHKLQMITNHPSRSICPSRSVCVVVYLKNTPSSYCMMDTPGSQIQDTQLSWLITLSGTAYKCTIHVLHT